MPHSTGMSAAGFYHEQIDRILSVVPGGEKFVHVQAGLAIWCAAAIVLRAPLRSRLPLAVVIAFELGNELMDRLHAGAWRWRDTAQDAVATLFWPAALYLLLNLEPLWDKAAKRRRN